MAELQDAGAFVSNSASI